MTLRAQRAVIGFHFRSNRYSIYRISISSEWHHLIVMVCKWPATWHLFNNNKFNIKTPYCWLFGLGIPQWPVDAYQNSPVMQKAFPCKNVIVLWTQNLPKGYMFMELFIVLILYRSGGICGLARLVIVGLSVLLVFQPIPNRWRRYINLRWILSPWWSCFCQIFAPVSSKQQLLNFPKNDRLSREDHFIFNKTNDGHTTPVNVITPQCHNVPELIGIESYLRGLKITQLKYINGISSYYIVWIVA